MGDRWGALSRRPLVVEIAVLFGALAAAALLIAIPLTDGNRVLGTHGDLEQFLWQVHRVPDALTGHWSTNNAFLGMPVAFAAVPTTWAHSLLVLSIDWLTGNLFYAYNAALLLLIAVNFASTYAVARLLGHRRAVATVAAALFAFASNTLGHAEGGHAGLPLTAAFPWILYAFVRLRGEPAARQWWVLLGFAVAACGYAHEYWLMGGLLTIPLALALRGRWIWRDKAVLAGAGIAFAIAVVLNIPMIVAFTERARLDRDNGVETVRTAEEGLLHASPPPAYLVPSDRNPVWSHAPLPYAHANHIETLNYLGLVNLGVLSVAAGAWWVRRQRKQYRARVDAVPTQVRRAWIDLLALGLLGLVLGFGTRMQLNKGLLRLPPTVLFSIGIPGYEHLRSWGRYGIFVMLVVTFATAEVLREWLARRSLKPAVLWGAVAAVILVAAIDQQPRWPVPMHRIAVPHSIDLVKDTPSDRFVLDLPLGVNDPLRNGTAMVLQVFHGRNIVNGYATGQPLFEKWLQVPPLACFAFPDERAHTVDPACAPGRLGPALARIGVATIIYEHTTAKDSNIGFAEDDDRQLRRRTMALLRGLERTGWLHLLAIDEPYSIYRFALPGR